ncbi:hypothetical protein SteCoe_4525 [Stentor coeruleus]|uniref:Tetratricopeptide repeat protein 29 n=1 Tax=Stentor coeruleus TaxID=5963 RepID=A0A1R2CUI4_9CILI|nr:hypothetical protein SteCoe_4525 [Stentor coeruleus]
MRSLLRKTTTKITRLVREESIKSIGSDKSVIADDILFKNAKEVYLKGNYAKALYCFEKLKETFQRDNITSERLEDINTYLIDLYGRIGKECSKNNSHFVAIAHYEKLKALKESRNDTKGVNEVLEMMADVYKSLANEFRHNGKYREAISYTNKRKDIYKKIGKNLSEINEQLEAMYSIKANEFYNKGNYKKSIELYEKLKEIFLEKDSSDNLLDLYGILGQLYFETSQIRNAVQNFTKLKDLAENKRDYIKKMHAFQHIGICFQLIKDYKTALNNFKMLLQLAWKENNIEMELLAYDYMSIQYFYLGDLEGARYYHNRTWKGITEKFTSPVREISNKALEALKSREKIPVRKHMERLGGLKKGPKNESLSIEIGLPSPRTSSGESDLQFLPVYPVNVTTSHANLPRSKSSFKNNSHKSLNTTMEAKKSNDQKSKNIKPFVLLSHLSPIESVKNFFYVDQINYHK